MDRDPSVFVMGQGIATTGAHLGGGLWGTVPLDHPKRLLETPLSEEAMTGFALGAAQAGMRPILTHIRADFLHLAMNQLVNMAAKRQAWGNQLRHGVVVRAVIGRSWGQGAQHSQAPYAALVNVPGLNIVAPVAPQQDGHVLCPAAFEAHDAEPREPSRLATRVHVHHAQGI